MTGELVRVHGLDELERALDRLGDGLDEQLRHVDEQVAEETARDAAGKARAHGGVAAKSAPAVSARDGAIALDGNAYPFAFGAEFGSIRYPQFETFRGSDPDTGGYFLYPAVRDRDEANVDAYVDGLEQLLNQTGLS